MSLLKQANHALRNGQYETAIRLYQQSLQDSPALAHIIQPNLKLAQSRHQKTGTAARQPSLPALPPKSSIDFAAMRVEDIISGAEQAMARDDWHSAYEHWNSLLTRPDEELSPQLLLRTSRELFKLDAFPQAAAALQRAATRNPQDPDVIREQAHQYYYHCYSSWLMLVTENEPDWYKADGLDKRPDWKTACELLEKAEKVSPRHNLRRYVQAYLLLAEDAWDKQNRTQAHAALDTALKAIGPNKLDQTLVQAIHTAVDQFRDGQVPENDPYYQTLQDQLKAMPLELLDVKNWLCLNDILNWNGLLLCGYVAREKAVDLALEQGKKENANKATLKTALKAALDRNDTKLADTYLGKLKRISPDAIDVRELDSCTELMKGNLDAFRQKWPHPPTPAEQRLRDYLKGKTVAVVGPAPTGTLDGEEIDRHDVVVRMNWRGQDSMPDAREFGSKTNISLYNAHTVRLLTADKRLEQTKSLDFRLIRRARHDAHQLQMIAEYPGSFYKSLNAVPAILFNLLLHGAEQIKLFKVTFYLGKQHHAESYRGKIDDGFGGMPLRGLQPVMANHDLIEQYSLTKNIFSSKICIEKKLHPENYLKNIICEVRNTRRLRVFLKKNDIDIKDLTIVITGKDVEKTIGKTLKSIEPAMNAGASCILVDDGSKDSTRNIMHEAANYFNKCEVIVFDENVGVGVAKNTGLDNVKTRIYSPLDGDDWVRKEYYFNLAKYFSSNPDLDFVRSMYINVEGTNRTLQGPEFAYKETAFHPRFSILPVNKSTLVDFAQICMGMYSVDFLNENSIRFSLTRSAEDQLFTWKIMLNAKKMILSNEYGYFYRRGHTTALTKIGDDRQLDFLVVLKEIHYYLHQKNLLQYYQKFVRKVFALICVHMDRMETYEPRVQMNLKLKTREFLRFLPEIEIMKGLDALDQRRKKIIEGVLQ